MSLKYPPPLNEENLFRYIQDPMLFRKEQWIMEPSPKYPKGCLFGDVVQDWQIEKIFDPIDLKQKNGIPQYQLHYIQICKKFGKCLGLNTPIPTINGWTTIKDIKKGDIIFDEKGNQCTVTFVTDTLYNHECYEITFSDGEKIIADKDHLWQTYTWKKDRNISKIRTTKDILDTLKLDYPYTKKENKTGWNHRIQIAEALKLPKIDLYLPPYVLGVWLGDGNAAHAVITKHKQDWDLLEEIKKEGVSIKKKKEISMKTPQFLLGGRTKNNTISFQSKLRKLKVLNNKHIPQQYLRASTEQRFALLQGLMDTDGFCAKTQGSCEFSSSIKTLAYNVFELIISLGLKPKITSRIPILYGKKCNRNYRIIFSAYKDKPIFRLKRKLDRLKNIPLKKTRSFYRQIVSIKKINSVPVKCLQVDSPSHLFLIGKSMIPTHNTVLLSGECIRQLLLTPYPSDENYLLAGDKNQAAYLFQNTVKFIKRNPNLDTIFRTYKNEVVIQSTGARLVVLSAEAATKQGMNPDFFVFDEFWNQPNRDLWDTMWLGMAAKAHGKGILITNAGFDQNSICYSIRELCKSQKHKRFYYYEPVGTELESLSTPWITKEWIEMERETLPANVFRRFRQNLWVFGGDAPFMPEEGWECFKGGMKEKSICSIGSHIIGVDVGLRKDNAAAVVLHRFRGKIVVDQIRMWKGSKNFPVPIQDIEDFIKNAIMNFSECELIMDPWQAVGTLQKFEVVGVRTEEFYLTVQNIVKLSKNLFYLFKNLTLEIPKHYELENELKGIQVIEKSYGWRIDHEKGGTSDITIALGMAALKSMQKGIEDDEMTHSNLQGLYFLDQDSIFRSTGKRKYIETTDTILSDIGDDVPKISNSSISRIF